MSLTVEQKAVCGNILSEMEKDNEKYVYFCAPAINTLPDEAMKAQYREIVSDPRDLVEVRNKLEGNDDDEDDDDDDDDEYEEDDDDDE
jgi:hypothetical protein